MARQWKSVQEYLDCDNARLTWHPASPKKKEISAEHRARMAIGSRNRGIRKRLLAIQHRPLSAYERRVLTRIQRHLPAHETPEERRNWYWFYPEHRQRHSETMRQWASERRARGLRFGRANIRSRKI